MKKVIIYTDGSCLGNPGPGGWAALLKYGEKEKEISGTDKETTNNRMELTAALKAIEELKSTCEIDIYTDSNYLRQGITEWVKKWQANNWRTAQKNPVKNKEIWQAILSVMTPHQINWHWVKAHNGDPNNERVDQLARLAAEKAREY